METKETEYYKSNRKRLEQFILDSMKLSALKSGGVEDWEGYERAMERAEKHNIFEDMVYFTIETCYSQCECDE